MCPVQMYECEVVLQAVLGEGYECGHGTADLEGALAGDGSGVSEQDSLSRICWLVLLLGSAVHVHLHTDH